MYKSLVLLCVVFCVIEARPRWQWLPPRDGYIPVYIRSGDTPLEEINPELAEAFHAGPAGRSAGKHLDASPDTPDQADQPRSEPEAAQVDQPRPESETPEQADQPRPESDAPVQADQPQSEPDAPAQADLPRTEPDTPEDSIDHRPYEKKVLEKKFKKAIEITKPVERR